METWWPHHWPWTLIHIQIQCTSTTPGRPEQWIAQQLFHVHFYDSPHSDWCLHLRNSIWKLSQYFAVIGTLTNARYRLHMMYYISYLSVRELWSSSMEPLVQYWGDTATQSMLLYKGLESFEVSFVRGMLYCRDHLPAEAVHCRTGNRKRWTPYGKPHCCARWGVYYILYVGRSLS